MTDKPTTEQVLAWVSEAWMEFRDDETAEIYDAQVEIKDAIRARLTDYDTEKARHAETLKVLVAVTEERDALKTAHSAAAQRVVELLDDKIALKAEVEERERALTRQECVDKFRDGYRKANNLIDEEGKG